MDSDLEVIRLEYTVLVTDTAANNHNDVKNNRAQFRWVSREPDPATADPTDSRNFQQGTAQVGDSVRVVEPNVSITNTVVVQTPGDLTDTDNVGDAGDEVTYTITLSNPSDRPVAYDSLLDNPLPADELVSLTLDGVALNDESLWTGAGLTVPSTDTIPRTGMANTDFEIHNDAGAISLRSIGGTDTFDVPPGGEITITVTGAVANTVTSSLTDVVSTATVTYTSLPEADGPDADERDATSSTNPYTAQATAPISILPGAPVKTIVSTSEGHTAGADVTVGEVVRYRIVADLVEGTETNVQLRDNLPDGLEFLNDGTATVALVQDTPGQLTAPDLSGAIAVDPTPESVTPTFVLPDSQISADPTGNDDTYGSGIDIFFKLGDVTNLGNNTGREVAIIEFNALVLNEAGVQAFNNATGAVDSTTLSNTVSLFANEPAISGTTQPLATSAPVDVEVVEPVIQVTNRLVGPAPKELGDTATYEIQITNTGDADAFELNLINGLGNGGGNTYAALTSSVTVVTDVNSRVDTGDLGTVGDTDLNIDLSQLAPGETVVLQVQVDLQADAFVPLTTDEPLIEFLDNEAVVTYTGLPGSGTTANSTGSPPGTERTGTDGVGGALNDYAANGAVRFFLGTPAIEKSIAGTDTGADVDVTDPTTEPATGFGSVAIGEIVTYRVAVSLTQGTDTNVVVTDTLPDGLAYVENSAKLVTDLPGLNGTVQQTLGSPLGDGAALTVENDTNPGDPLAFGDDLRFTFEQVDIGADTDPNNNTFYIEYQAEVVRDSTGNPAAQINNAGDVLQGPAALSSDTITTPVASNEPAVTVVEPQLSLRQAVELNGAVFDEIGDERPIGQASEVARYTLTLDNAAGSTSTAAHDVRLEHRLAADKFTVGSLSQIAVPAGYTLTSTTSGNEIVVTIAGDPTTSVAPGESLEFVFELPLSETVQNDEVLVGTARVTAADSISDATTTGAGLIMDDPSTPEDESVRQRSYTPVANNTEITVGGPAIRTELVTTEVGEPNPDLPGGKDVTVGELVTIRTTLSLPGANGAGTDFVNALIREELDSGLAFVGITRVTSADPAVLSSNVISTLDLMGINGALSVDANGTGFDIDLGRLTKIGAAGDDLVIEYQAVVLNTVANQDGVQLNNDRDNTVNTADDVRFEWISDSSMTPLSTRAPAPADVVTLVEPNITLSQTVSVGDDGGTSGVPGDQVIYTFVVENPSGGDAFDLDLSASLPAAFVPDGANPIVVVLEDPPISTTAVVDSRVLSIDTSGAAPELVTGGAGFDVLAGERVTIQVIGSLDESAVSGSFLPSNSNVTWTSLDGDFSAGDRSIHTTNGDVERTGADGVGGALNDYAVDANVLLEVEGPAPALLKTIAETDLPGTVDPGDSLANQTPVVIGETVTYELRVTLPEGTTEDLVIEDLLPTGMTLVPNSITTLVLNTDRFNGILVPPTVTGDGSTGNPLTFTFSVDPEVTADQDFANNTFTIQYQAVVQNVGANQLDTLLTGDARLTYTDPVDGTVTRVVEPALDPSAIAGPPDTEDAAGFIQPGSAVSLSALGELTVPVSPGSDVNPDGSVASYNINLNSFSATQGTLYLGDPTNGGTALPATGIQNITADALSTLYFQAASGFTGVVIDYAAVDDDGEIDPTPGAITLQPLLSNRSNLPPDSQNAVGVVTGTTPLNLSNVTPNLGGTDPDDTVAAFNLVTLPDSSDGLLSLNGTSITAGNLATVGQGLTATELRNLVFSPDAGFDGNASFTYVSVDQGGLVDPSPATVILTNNAGAIAGPPDTNDANGLVPPGTAVSLTASGVLTTPVTAGSDVGSGGSVVSYIIDLDSFSNTQGTLYLGDPAASGTALPSSGTHTITAAELSTLYFDATIEFAGVAIEYVAVDNDGNQDPTPGVITLNPPSRNLPPDTRSATGTVVGTDPLSLSEVLPDLGGSDPNGSADLATFNLVTLPTLADGVLSLNGTNITDPADGQGLTSTDLANLVFTPTANFDGTTFTYEAVDQAGAVDPSPATVTLKNEIEPTAIVVEPNLRITQTVTLNSGSYGAAEDLLQNDGDATNDPTLPTGDGGDRATFTLEVSNSGNGPAYDTRIVQVLDATKFDFLDAGGAVDLTKFTEITVPDGYSDVPTVTQVGSTNTYQVAFEDEGAAGLVPSDSQSVSFQVALNDAANGGEVITNNAFIDYADSVPGNPTVQRVYVNGADGTEVDANQTRVAIADPIIYSELARTEIDNGGTNGVDPAVVNGDQVVIGEIATFNVVMALPEGTYPDAQIVEQLDPGLEFRQIIGFTAPDELLLVSNVGTGSETSVLLNTLSLTDIRSLVTSDPDGHGFTFALGANQALRNLSGANRAGTGENNGATPLVLVYETVVLDEGTNFTGVRLDNNDDAAPQNTQFSWNNGSAQIVNADQPADSVTIIEPELGLTQTLTLNGESYGPTEELLIDDGNPATNPNFPSGDGGDRVDFQLDVANTGNAVAHDLRIVQTLDPEDFDLLNAAGTDVDSTKVTAIGVPTGFDSTPMLTLLPSGLVEIAFEYTGTDGFGVTTLGGPQAITFSAVLRDTVQAGEIVVNEAFIGYADSIDDTPTSGVQRVYADEANGTPIDANETRLLVRRPAISTTLLGTEFANGSTLGSDAVTNGDRAVIGEKASFQISADLPEETFPQAQIIERFDSGLGFVEITGFDAGDDLVLITDEGLVTENVTPLSALTLAEFRALVTVDGDGHGFTFAIANNQLIRNLSFPLNNGNQTLNIQYDTVVLNEVSNQEGVELNNGDDGGPNTPNTQLIWELTTAGTNPGDPDVVTTETVTALAPAAPVTVVEPVLALNQSVIVRTPGVPTDNDDDGNPGDLVTYTLVIDGTSSPVDAYEIGLMTLFPEQFVPAATDAIAVDSAGTTVAGVTAGNFQITTVGTQPQLSLAGGADIDVLAGQQITLTVSGTISNAAVSGAGLSSNSDLTWTSLNGVVTDVIGDSREALREGTETPRPDFTTTDTERTGVDGVGGALNDYAVTANAPIDIDGVTPTLIKSIPVTSEPLTENPADSTTAPTPGAIGEVMTYRLAVKLSEGTTNDVAIADVVPDGLTFVAGSARLLTELDGNIFDGSLVANGDTPGVDPGLANGTTLTPATSAVAGGQQLLFNFGGTQILGDNDPSDDTFYIEYQAIVENVAGNQDGASPTTLQSGATLDFTNANGTQTVNSNEPQVLVTEPLLNLETRVLDRFDVPQDADDAASAVSVTVGDRVTIEIEIAAPTTDDFDGPAFEVALTNTLPNGLTFDGNLVSVSGPSPATLTYDNATNQIVGDFDVIRDGETVVIRYDVIVSDPGGANITDTASITYTSLPGTVSTERTGADGLGGVLNDFAAEDPANLLINNPPETDDAIYNSVTPNSTTILDGDGVLPVLGDRLGGSDPDTGDSVEVFIINTLPPADQGQLFFNDPVNGRSAVTVGQEIAPNQLNLLEFDSTNDFTGTEFTYLARDTFGATDPTPATVSLTPGNNLPPDTESVTRLVQPGETLSPVLPLPVPTGEEPYGTDADGTVNGFRIVSLPDATDGTLFFDANNDGTLDPGEAVTTPGLTIPEDQIDRLDFVAEPTFDGGSFDIAAVDNDGFPDPTPGTVTLQSVPETTGGSQTVIPGEVVALTNLTDAAGTDPDGTVTQYRVVDLTGIESTDGILYLGAVSPATRIQPGQVISAADLNNLVFDTGEGFDGASFTIAAIDNNGNEDPTPATFTLNTPPETEDAVGELTSNDVLELSTAVTGTAPNTVVPLTAGTDADGTVESYRIDVATITEGELFIGDPNTGGRLIDATNNTIPATDLANLHFRADGDFAGGVEIQYVAIDNLGAEDASPGVIYLNTPGANVRPTTVDENGVVPVNGTLPLNSANGVDLGGDDPDGTVDFFEIDMFPTTGRLFLGDPTVPANEVMAGQQIPVADIGNLVFVADDPANFAGDEFTYAAIDNDGLEDLSPATVRLTTPPQTGGGEQTIAPNTATQLNQFPATSIALGNDPDGATDGVANPNGVFRYQITAVPDASDGTLYLGDPADSNSAVVTVGQRFTEAELRNLYFDAEPGFDGGSFAYAAVDEEGTIDQTPAVYVLNGPPDTEDAMGRLAPGTVIELDSAAMTVAIAPGSDVDGTVDFYQIDLSSFPTAQGTLSVGSPAAGAQPLDPDTPGGTIATIPASQLDDLFFNATNDFTGVAIRYSAVDNNGNVDPTPGTITLVPSNGNLPPDTVSTTQLVPDDSPLTIAGLGGSDPDESLGDSVDNYVITSLPDGVDGILYLGSATPGNEISVGDMIPAAQLGNITFDPTPEFNGGTFTYAAVDSNGAQDPSPAVVQLTAPPETNGGSQLVIPGQEVPLTNLNANFGSDPDGTVVSFEIVSLTDIAGTDGTLYLGSVTPGNQVTVGQIIPADQIDSLVFEAGAGFDGASFTLRAIDNNGNPDPTPGTFTLQAPPETEDAIGTIAPGSDTQLTALPVGPTPNTPLTAGNDPDGDNSNLTYTIDLGTLPDPIADGVLYLGDPAAAGVPIDNSNNTGITDLSELYFRATGTFDGGVAIDYVAVDEDGNADPTPATIFLNPTGANIPPTTVDAEGTVPLSGTLPLTSANGIDLGGDDVDGTVDDFRITSLPTDGTLFLGDPTVPANEVILNQEIPAADIGNLVFVADNPASFSGDSFTYGAIDDDGDIDGSPATVRLTIPPNTFGGEQSIVPNQSTLLNQFPTTIGADPDTQPGEPDVDNFRITALPDGADGLLYLGNPSLSTSRLLQKGDVLSEVELRSVFFAASPTFDGGFFTYASIDNEQDEDASPAIYTLNGPPDTNDAFGEVAANGFVELDMLPAPGMAIAPGTDVDGTVDQYQLDVTNLDTAVQGQFFDGQPGGGGSPLVPVDDLITITAAQLGTLFFNAAAGFTGINIPYQAIDNDGNIDPTPGFIRLVPPGGNLPPDTNDSSQVVEGLTPVMVPGLGGSDPENDIQGFVIKTLPDPTDGTLYLGDPSQPGATVIDQNWIDNNQLLPGGLNNVFFEPEPGFNGGSFTYATVDNQGIEDPTPATVTLTTVPQTNDVVDEVAPGDTITIDGIFPSDPTANTAPGGTDPDGNVTRFVIETLPADGTLYLGTATPGNEVTVGQPVPSDRINELVFTADGGFTGTSFTYRAIDNDNNPDPTPGTITLNPPPAQIPPTTEDASGRLDPGAAIELDAAAMVVPLSPGSDVDGTVDSYEIDLSSFPAAQGTLSLNNSIAGGGTLVEPDVLGGTVATIAAADLTNLFFNATGAFTGVEIDYVAVDNDGNRDGSPGVITLVPDNANLPPNTDDAQQLVEGTTPVLIPGLGGSDPDTGIGDSVGSFVIKTLPDPADGILYVGDPSTGTPVVVDTPLTPADIVNLFFEPTAGFDGGTFTYAAIDQRGAEDPTPATVQLRIAPQTNDVLDSVPVDAVVNLDGVIPGTAVNAPLGGSDTDGTINRFIIETVPDPADGVLYLGNPASGNGVRLSAGDPVPANRIDELFFESTTSFNGTSFTYRAIDDDGNPDPTPATVTLNAPPDTTNGRGSLLPNTSIQIGGTEMEVAIAPGNDTDPVSNTQTYTAPENLVYRITSLPDSEAGQLVIGSTPVTLNQELTPDQLLNELVFQAGPNFNGSTQFTYAAIDQLRAVDGSPGVVVLNALGAPDTVGDSQNIRPGTTANLDLPTVIGIDNDGTVEQVRITSLPEGTDGVLYLGTPDPANVVTLNQNIPVDQVPNLQFEATPGFNGGSFTYAVIDNDGLVDPSPATFVLNAPPETNNAVGELSPNQVVQLTSLSETPLAAGTDPEDGAPSTYVIDVSTLPDPAQGQLLLQNPDGTRVPINNTNNTLQPDQLDDLYFQAASGFTGGVEINYQAVDSENFVDSTPGTIFLNPPNTALAPDTEDSSGTVRENETINVPGLGGSDPDGTVQTFRIISPPNNGQLFLGDPTAGGTPLTTGSEIPADRINDLFFTADPAFPGDTFSYAAIDNDGNLDLSAATVTLGTPPETVAQTEVVTPGQANPLTFPTTPIGSDPDGTVDNYRITSVPAPGDGLLYVGDPALGDVVIQGRELTPTQLAALQFQATPGFDGGTFEFAAIDDGGLQDPTPAVYTLQAPPETNDASGVLNSGEMLRLAAPPASDGPSTITPLTDGTDPDGTVDEYVIDVNTITEGRLFVGNPAAGGFEITALNNTRPASDLGNLYFEADSDFVGGVAIEYAAIDNDRNTDATPGVIRLNTRVPNLPPNTDDASGTLLSNQVLQLSAAPRGSNPTVVDPLVQGTDSDGTVESYRINVATITEGSCLLAIPMVWVRCWLMTLTTPSVRLTCRICSSELIAISPVRWRFSMRRSMTMALWIPLQV